MNELELAHFEDLANVLIEYDLNSDTIKISSKSKQTGDENFSYTFAKDGSVIDKTYKNFKPKSFDEDLDAQRDVAFRVVFFFISFILFCFGMLYLYHKLQQSAIPNEKDKQSFFDFLAGQIEDDYNVEHMPKNSLSGLYMR